MRSDGHKSRIRQGLSQQLTLLSVRDVNQQAVNELVAGKFASKYVVAVIE